MAQDPDVEQEVTPATQDGSGDTGPRRNPEALHTAASLRSNPRAKRIAIAAVVVLVLVVFLLWRYFASYESTDDAQIDGHIHSISARVSGHVARVNVDDNQQVKAGEALVEIDSKDYEVALARAEADLADAQANAAAARAGLPITSVNTASQLASARADVHNAHAGLSGAESQYAAAQAKVREAEANNAKAQQDLKRYAALIAKDEISHQQYDQAVAAAQSSAATLDAARAAQVSAQQQISQAQGGIESAQAGLASANTRPQQVSVTRSRAQAAEAQLERAQAVLEQARLNLQYTKVVAPVDGIVGRKSVEAGQNVQVGQELMSLVDIDDIWVTANYKETQLKHMRPGEPASIKVDAYGRKYKGHVDSIGAASGARFSLLPPENATGNYVKVVQRIPVKIILDKGENSDHLLRPGMSVTPKVQIK